MKNCYPSCWGHTDNKGIDILIKYLCKYADQFILYLKVTHKLFKSHNLVNTTLKAYMNQD